MPSHYNRLKQLPCIGLFNIGLLNIGLLNIGLHGIGLAEMYMNRIQMINAAFCPNL